MSGRIHVLTPAVAVASIAGFVALWSLAGYTAVIAYRQIADHRCLTQLSIPSGLLQVGVVALGVSIVAMLVTLFAQNRHGRKRSIWVIGAYMLVAVPLLVTSVVLYVNVRQPSTIVPTACIGGADSLLEESQ